MKRSRELPIRVKMGSEMDGCNGLGKGINSFAVVSYLIEPLASFFDQLRRELAPSYHAKAHVTVLPPRPLFEPPEQAWDLVKSVLVDVPAFNLELGEIKIFPETHVIYVSIGQGHAELERMHEALNVGALEFHEPFHYCPHLTLGQELAAADLEAATEHVKQRWYGSNLPRYHMVDHLTFVQNTMEDRWTDLAALDLETPVTR